MKCYHGFTITDDDDPDTILHFVGFEKPPTEHDWNGIMEELQTDPEFRMLDEDRWSMRYSTAEELEHFQKIMDEAEHNGTIRYNEEVPRAPRQ